jgi:hypothetical protein
MEAMDYIPQTTFVPGYGLPLAVEARPRSPECNLVGSYSGKPGSNRDRIMKYIVQHGASSITHMSNELSIQVDSIGSLVNAMHKVAQLDFYWGYCLNSGRPTRAVRLWHLPTSQPLPHSPLTT